ncbi:MAG: histidine phosphatase family protein [Mycobacteriaceae bacterium]
MVTGAHHWRKRLTVVALTTILFVLSPITAWAATSITLTWVRHGQSVDNVYHYLGTVAPGPVLSSCEVGPTACVDQLGAIPGPSILPGYTQEAPGGQQQAQALLQRLIATGTAYDAIYASTLVRTQLTAQPYADYRGLSITVLDGLREVRAGADEGAVTTPPDARMQNYIDVQNAWRQGWVLTPMPQSPTPSDANGDLNGIVFNDRTNAAVEKIYWDEINKYPTFTADAVNPDANPLVFSHFGTISTWVLMNVKNPDFEVISNNPLDNTSTAVVVGNPIDGWTLVSWAGQAVSPTPSLGAALFVDVRDYGVVWQRAIWNVAVAQQSGDPVKVLQALGSGVGEIAQATIGLPGNVLGSVAGSLFTAVQPTPGAAVQPGPTSAKASTPASLSVTPSRRAAAATPAAAASGRPQSTAAVKSLSAARPVAGQPSSAAASIRGTQQGVGGRSIPATVGRRAA